MIVYIIKCKQERFIYNIILTREITGSSSKDVLWKKSFVSTEGQDIFETE